MRFTGFLITVVCLAALGGCATGTASQDIEKGLISAHIAFEGAGVGLRAAATSGVLKGGAATSAQQAYDAFATDLAQADADWNAGNTGAVTADLSKVTADQTATTSLIPATH
jgi:hypothetical protein